MTYNRNFCCGIIRHTTMPWIFLRTSTLLSNFLIAIQHNFSVMTLYMVAFPIENDGMAFKTVNTTRYVLLYKRGLALLFQSPSLIRLCEIQGLVRMPEIQLHLNRRLTHNHLMLWIANALPSKGAQSIYDSHLFLWQLARSLSSHPHGRTNE